jgi:hypothetical protein
LRPFAARRLPDLPGKEPLGGKILSHDFVEAALLRRAGWRVEIAGDIVGSYEEAPPTIVDLAARDRRWAQGNIQQIQILFAKGFDWLSKVHIRGPDGLYVGPAVAEPDRDGRVDRRQRQVLRIRNVVRAGRPNRRVDCCLRSALAADLSEMAGDHPVGGGKLPGWNRNRRVSCWRYCLADLGRDGADWRRSP